MPEERRVSEPCSGPPAPPRVVVTSLAADRQPVIALEPGGHVALVPVGVCHGAALGDEVTLCGLGTEALSWFPGLSFAAADFLLRCEACVELVDSAAP